MRTAVIGCGSLGLLWGARFTQIPGALTLLTRSKEQQQQLNQYGIDFESLDGRKKQIPVQAMWIEELPQPVQFDMVHVMVKQNHLPPIIPILQEITSPTSRLLFWQNGLGHEKQIELLANRPWTYAAITTEGAHRSSYNTVKHTGKGETWVGPFPKLLTFDPPIQEWIIAVENLGLQIAMDQQIFRRMWEKLAINCVVNPITALHQVKNGELLSSEYISEIEKISREVQAVAQKKGFSFELDDMIQKVAYVCRNTKNNYSSMLQDLLQGRQTEIDYMNGAIIRYGKEEKIPTAYNQYLVERIHHRENNG
ncbi:ketopantoate reductase family protein [Thermoflavimicrobium daqui]|nr:2-dehydropantoate 2-reductase [Thermoflavimicrobium daqui]